MAAKERLERLRALIERWKGDEKPLAQAYLADYETMTRADRAAGAEKKRDAAAEACLTERGRSLIPDYLPEDRAAAAAAAAAIRNFSRVRELFARGAGNPEGAERREAGRLWLEAAALAYCGAARTDVTISLGKGILKEKRRLVLRNLTAEELPEALRGSYDPARGLFACRGLRAYLARREETLVVAFSGTVLDTKMIEADFMQAFAYSWVYLGAAGLVAALKERLPGLPIVLCGHSLGGGLAQFALAANIGQSGDLEAYCYNAAGLNFVAYQSLARLGTLDLARTRVWHYGVEGEPVSAFFGQIGKMTVYPAPRGFNLYQRHRLNAVRMSMDGQIY